MSDTLESPGARSRKWIRWAAPLCLCLVTLLAFLPAFDARFLNLDDQPGIEHNQKFRGLSPEHLDWMFRTGKMGHYQPLSWVTLAIDHVLWDMDPRGYHATNVLLHVLGSLAVYFLAGRLLRLLRGSFDVEQRASTEERIAALIAALAFAVHPLRVESVAWATERRDVLSGVFFVLAIHAWLRATSGTRPSGVSPGLSLAALATAAGGSILFLSSLDLGQEETLALRGPGAIGLVVGGLLLACSSLLVWRALHWQDKRASVKWIVLALACMFLSLLSKAWGIVLPALLLVLDAWPLRRLEPREEGPGARTIALLLEKLPFVVLAVPFSVLAVWAQASQSTTMMSLAEHGPAQRAAQALYGLGFYAWKMLVPASLVPFHDIPPDLSLLQPRFALAAAAVLALTLVLVLLRRRFPAGLTAWCAYALTVAPVLGLVQSGPQLIADRYSYLSCLPFALLLGGAVLAARRSDSRVLRFAPWVAAMVLALWVALTFRQTARWHDSETLMQYTLEIEPAQPDAHLALAMVRREQAASASEPGKRRELLLDGVKFLEQGRAIRSDPRFESALSGIHMELSEIPGLDANTRARHREQALDLSRQALEIAQASGQPVLPSYFLTYGISLLAAGRPEKALEPLQLYVRAKPRRAPGHAALGEALLAAGRAGEAADELQHALEIDPDPPRTWLLLGQARETQGDRARAIQAYREAQKRAPADSEATLRLRRLGQ
jgi:tetratricopeptide (TPR) repeat protein